MEERSLSSRMSTEHENTEELHFESLFQYFKRKKVAIAKAIRKPFPFLEGLRDHDLITNKMYEDFQDSCRHLVPVHNVIYKALEELEKIFDMPVLQELFSKANMETYPDLKFICKSFENAFQGKLCFQGSDRGDPNSQLSLEQGSGDNCSQGSLTWSPLDPSSSDGWRSNDRKITTLINGNQIENHQFSDLQDHTVVSLPENGLSEDLCEAVQTGRMRIDTTGDNTGELERKGAIILQGLGSEPGDSSELETQLNNRDAWSPESPSLLPWNEERAVLSSHGIQINPCSVHLVDIKKENPSFFLDSEQHTRARTNHNQESEVIVLSSDDSDDGNNFSEASTLIISQPEPVDSRKPPTPRKTYRRRDTSNTDSSSTKKRQRRIQRKKRNRSRKYEIKNIKIPTNPSGRKALQRRHDNSSSRRGRKRGLRIPKEKNVDFNSAKLLVTCGTAIGTLYKEKFKQGISQKSIETKNGQWFTPTEFEIEGGRERSKKWRQSIHCDVYTLKELIEKGHLPNPSRKKQKKKNPPNPRQTKKKLENPEKCKVCHRQQWKLYACAMCRKFYHKKCHIPPVEDKSGQWRCVFCKSKDQLRSQGNQVCHKESEVLKRKMLPKEQLKCELLLLTIYCCPKSDFFIPKPKQRKEDFPDLQEHMWLNKIKNRLNKKAYHSVQRFVRDMRLIFENHSMFYKNSPFKNLGVAVRNKFEKTFKGIFSIKDTSKQLQPCKHTILLT